MSDRWSRSAAPGGPGSHLRLVTPAEGLSLREAESHRAVEDEVRAASAMAPDDLRAALAARAAESIEGGRAALLPSRRRRELVDSAVRQGMAPFEANLVIAVVQDAARRGEDPGGRSASARVAMIPVARADRSARWAWVRPALAAAALAGLMLNALIHWVVG